MCYKTIEFHVRGVAPLLMHNGQLANPRNKFAKAMKEITSKRKKTEEDHNALADLEFLGGLYVDDDGHPTLPGELVEAAIVNGAKKTKNGKNAKAAIIVDGNASLVYTGPKTAEELKNDDRFRHIASVSVGQSKVMRTRPIFKTWEVTFTVSYLPDTFNENEVVSFVEAAGRIAGFGDGRPRFGRFEIVKTGAAA